MIAIESSRKSSSCSIRAKKKGKATVTYTNSKGARIKYKFTVTYRRTYPIDDAYFQMNSVGGLEPHILISNNSGRKIKYVHLVVSFYNRVGDKVSNEIGGRKYAKLLITGPIKPWRFKWYSWDPVFYDTTASKMKIETAKIIYKGGRKKTIRVNKKYKEYYD